MYPNLALTLAYLLDLILGDPRGWPHPVKIMGRGIGRAEKLLWHGGKGDRWWGLVLWLLIVLPAYFIPWWLIQMVYNYSSLGAIMVSIILIYWCLSVKGLAVEAGRVRQALEGGDLEKAKGYLALIVGRDPKRLEQEEIIRATVETVAENITDGIISPLFYAFIGGAPLAMAYKAVNTLDSMVGYKNEKYRYFGYFSAKADDIFNYIPARLSVFFIYLACLVLRKNPLSALITAIQDGKKHPSPNAGLPEAAVAGALGLRLGGPNFYQGILVEKPYLGRHNNTPTVNNIREVIKIMHTAALLAVIAACLINLWL
ncbi:MAG: cobalamin biosynthesis protein CobD [Nitrospinae bacterium RIFCSPLOWO2_12_FULL_45_22]|nr:MAG: cobalamin biosynthesis protein CobD [Nitrospinae bacterium RIFCSPLOWO2_12_FULL_45_22]